MSAQPPPNFYFPTIGYNPANFKSEQSNLSIDYLNTLYLSRNGLATSIALDTNFTGSVETDTQLNTPYVLSNTGTLELRGDNEILLNCSNQINTTCGIQIFGGQTLLPYSINDTDIISGRDTGLYIGNCNEIASATNVNLTLTSTGTGSVVTSGNIKVGKSILAHSDVNALCAVPVRLFRSYRIGPTQSIVGTTPVYILPGTGLGTMIIPANFITNGMTFRLRICMKQNTGGNGNMLFALAFKNVSTNAYTILTNSSNTVPVASQTNQGFGIDLIFSFEILGPNAVYSMGYLTIDREGQTQRVCIMDQSVTNTVALNQSYEVNFSYATTVSNTSSDLRSYQYFLDVI